MNQTSRVYIYMHCQLKTQAFTGCVWAPALTKSGRVRWSLNVADTERRDTYSEFTEKIKESVQLEGSGVDRKVILN